MTVLERFLKYIAVETTSNEASTTCPSTPNQKVLGQMLVDELLGMGLTDANMDDNGYVMASIPSNVDKDVPTLGFIAHMDTAPDLTTKDIKPRVVENYDGSVLVLNEEKDIVLSPEDYPSMLNYTGQDLVVTNGLTLLGADDKAGIAEIMTAVEVLTSNKDIPHGEIKIGFTPDEEIGRGADKFDVEKFNATYAYTLDGGPIGELEFESFNANNVKMVFHGRNVHPGYAKDRMINSMEMAQEFHAMLPHEQRPQFTSGYEGFYHQIYFKGIVEETSVGYIIRDHDRDLFEERKALFVRAMDFINAKYGEGSVEADMKDMYYNMGEKIEPVFEIVDIAKKAMIDLDIEPLVHPIRGGTDGARLSFMGLPCPNIFAGGHNFHGKHEFVPVQSMEKAVLVVLGIIDGFVNK
jgi:tripeptide aminopeptidase